MERSYPIIKRNSYTRSATLRYFSTNMPEHGFDVLPGDIRSDRICEDCTKGCIMATAHAWINPTSNSTSRNDITL